MLTAPDPTQRLRRRLRHLTSAFPNNTSGKSLSTAQCPTLSLLIWSSIGGLRLDSSASPSARRSHFDVIIDTSVPHMLLSDQLKTHIQLHRQQRRSPKSNAALLFTQQIDLHNFSYPTTTAASTKFGCCALSIKNEFSRLFSLIALLRLANPRRPSLTDAAGGSRMAFLLFAWYFWGSDGMHDGTDEQVMEWRTW